MDLSHLPNPDWSSVKSSLILRSQVSDATRSSKDCTTDYRYSKVYAESSFENEMVPRKF